MVGADSQEVVDTVELAENLGLAVLQVFLENLDSAEPVDILV